jgi:hypothetical protein
VGPSDGDAYLNALRRQFRTGLFYARIARDTPLKPKG